MQHPTWKQWEPRVIHATFVALFLVAVGLLNWIGQEFPLQFDLTAANRHSLPEASQAALNGLGEPLKITAFANQGSEGQLRRAIAAFVARYQRYKSNISLEFVDPDVDPERVRRAGVRGDGELIFEYRGKREHLALAQLSDGAVTNLLTQLGHRGEHWLVFLSGHGERSPDRPANFDLSDWAAHLRSRGFNLRALSLGDHPQIPQNTTVLVVAGPRVSLLSGEAREIGNYIERGGNLLWLADPGPLHGLESVAEMLGIEFLPGAVVDRQSERITGDPTLLAIANYGIHPVVRQFTITTVFPRAGALQVEAPEGWESAVILDTRESAWLETGPVSASSRFDKEKDVRGPLNLAVALTRSIDDRQQRIAVVNNGEFIANRYLGVGGNLELGMSLVNWLSHEDAYVSIPVQTARDRTLELSYTARGVIAGIFLLVLPLLLVTGGVIVWLRRRRR